MQITTRTKLRVRLCICEEAGGFALDIAYSRMEPKGDARGQEWRLACVLKSLDLLLGRVFCACHAASHTPTLPPRHTQHSYFTNKLATSGWASSCPGQPEEEEMEGEEDAMFYRQAGRRGWKRS